MALGEEEALSLGVEIEKVRWRLFLCVALLTGGALAAVGVIAFFGLVLPHIIRLLQGPDNKQLIPLCMLAGAADTEQFKTWVSRRNIEAKGWAESFSVSRWRVFNRPVFVDFLC